jgi:hypothetical protein
VLPEYDDGRRSTGINKYLEYEKKYFNLFSYTLR